MQHLKIHLDSVLNEYSYFNPNAQTEDVQKVFEHIKFLLRDSIERKGKNVAWLANKDSSNLTESEVKKKLNHYNYLNDELNLLRILLSALNFFTFYTNFLNQEITTLGNAKSLNITFKECIDQDKEFIDILINRLINKKTGELATFKIKTN